MDALFTEHWEDIYCLAGLIEDRHIASEQGKDFLEPIKNRFRSSKIDYDADWKQKLGGEN